MQSIRKTIEIRKTPDVAFKKFVNEFNSWWPKEYTWSQNTLKEIKIDGKVNGLCTETGPFGFRCDWGRVTEIAANRKIGIKWQISARREPIPNPEKASDLSVQFKPKGDYTTLEFEHLNFENHGEESENYREQLAGKYGWDFILQQFKTYCEQ